MSIVAIPSTRCEIILSVVVLAKGKAQCPDLAVGFWSPGKGVWHPVCMTHLEGIQASNLARDVKYLPIQESADLSEPVLRAHDVKVPA